MRAWRNALSALMILALMLVLASCGGKTTSTSASVAAPTPTPAPPAPTPTPVPGATPVVTVLDHVEEAPWLTCGACGNNGGTGPVAAFSDTLGIGTPSEDGSSTQFSIAATVPFTNGYFYQQHTPVTNPMTALTYEFGRSAGVSNAGRKPGGRLKAWPHNGSGALLRRPRPPYRRWSAGAYRTERFNLGATLRTMSTSRGQIKSDYLYSSVDVYCGCELCARN